MPRRRHALDNRFHAQYSESLFREIWLVMEIPALGIVGIARESHAWEPLLRTVSSCFGSFPRTSHAISDIVCPLVVRCLQLQPNGQRPHSFGGGKPADCENDGEKGWPKKGTSPFSLVRPSPVSPLSDSQALSDLWRFSRLGPVVNSSLGHYTDLISDVALLRCLSFSLSLNMPPLPSRRTTWALCIKNPTITNTHNCFACWSHAIQFFSCDGIIRAAWGEVEGRETEMDNIGAVPDDPDLDHEDDIEEEYLQQRDLLFSQASQSGRG